MNTKKILTLLLCLIIATISSLSAQAVGDQFKSGQLYYQITSLSPKEVAVVPQFSNYPHWDGSENPTGGITIPTSVAHNGTTYSLTNIGDSVFYECTAITSITIPNSVTNIGEGAFYQCTGLTNITIPNSVTSIGNSAFQNCIGLTNITIPNSVTNIGDRVFEYCKGLTNITIPNSVTSIGNWAFSVCTGLSSITIPNSVTNIGEGAFIHCTGLTSITIPNSVTNIGGQAFRRCTGLTSITSKIADLSQLTTGWYLFYEVDKNNCILYVPKGKVADYQAARQWKEFTNIKEIEGSGISQVDAERYIALSPNPARDEVTISIAPALVEQVSSLTLLDSNGKALQKQAITSSETIIDLTHYTSGIYFVQIDNVVKKLIIK